MFRGSYLNSIDAKGRCIIPAKFRHELGDRCVLVMGLDECLYLYTETEWENFTNSYLAGLPDDDKESHDLKLFFNSNMKVCDIDRQGRINIPRAYIDYAHIERDMLNVGFVEKIEIWGKEVFDAKMGSEEMNPRNLLRKIRENKARS